MERNLAAAQYRSFVGEQNDLIIASVPAGADPTLVGKTLKGQALTVAGTYTCVFPTNGFRAAVEVHITATLVTQTITTDVYSTFNDESTKKTSYTGVGALATATKQTSTYVPKGERRGIVSIPIVGAGSSTFTLAEYNGV